MWSAVTFIFQKALNFRHLSSFDTIMMWIPLKPTRMKPFTWGRFLLLNDFIDVTDHLAVRQTHQNTFHFFNIFSTYIRKQTNKYVNIFNL